MVKAINQTLHILYAVIILPLAKLRYYEQWFLPIITILALPLYLLLHLGHYTRPSTRKRRRLLHRRCHNHRIRSLLVTLSAGFTIIHPTAQGLSYTLDPFCALATGLKGESKPPSPCYFHYDLASHETFFQDLTVELEPPLDNLSTPLTPLNTTPSLSIDEFLQPIDVLQHARLLTKPSLKLCPALESLESLSPYSELPTNSPLYKRILLQASSLKAVLQPYQQTAPLSNPLIYVSSKHSELPIVIDTGASCSVTPILTDFKVPPTRLNQGVDKMEGLRGDTTPVLGAGPIRWQIEDVEGQRSNIDTIAYYVPAAKVRLFSPQTYLKEQAQLFKRDLTMVVTKDTVSLETAELKTLKFPIQADSHLPLMLTEQALHPTTPQRTHLQNINRFTNFVNFLCSEAFIYFDKEVSFTFNNTLPEQSNLADIQPVLKRSNWNLSEAQRELILWHNRLGHIGFKQVQAMLSKPRDPLLKRIITPSNHKSSHCSLPLCEACQYAKQKRRNPPSQKTQSRPELEGALSVNKLEPGQRISVDLYQSHTRGRHPDSFGKEKTETQFTGGAIFVDHATKFIHHTHQSTMTASETVRSKHAFEQHCDRAGVTIQEYVADNNPFHSSEWTTDCKNQQQTTHYSGVGAHHQNYAERNIQTVFNMARAMMLHFAIHWPQRAHPSLWPFALDQAVYIWNHLPNVQTRLSPSELFKGIHYRNHNHLQRLHVFGCPVYVLEPKIQDGKKLPKWQRRSRQAIYLGVSKLHSTTVHLVLNPESGKVTPQYHVVFDDHFSTVYSGGEFTDSVWDSLLESNLERHPHLTTTPDQTPFTTQLLPNQTEQDQPSTELSETTPPLPSTSANPTEPRATPPFVPEGVPIASEGAHLPTVTEPPQSSEPPPSLPTPPPAPRRSTRIRNPVDRLTLFSPNAVHRKHLQSMFTQTPQPSGPRQVRFRQQERPPRVTREKLNQQYLAGLNWSQLKTLCQTAHSTLAAFSAELNQKIDKQGYLDYLNPAIFATMANKEDNPTYKEAMASADAAGFIQAMIIEIETLLELDVFEIVNRPLNQKVLSGVWAFKRKRYPDGTVRKLKARYCARGFEQQHGVDYFETFAPVVMWLTVRLLLIMSILMNLETQQIDYTAAFVHADIDCLVYVDMPKGFTLPNKVWRLKKSLYGLAQSPRNFFIHTKTQLTTKFGFTQSEADPCLFISDTVICLIYVEDALLFYKDATAIDELKRRMNEENVPFREEEDVAGFLGVHIDRRSDNTIHLTQSGLAKQIVDTMHLDNSETKAVESPCLDYLPIDEDGEPAHGEFSYPSVVGQLNYLAGHTRCDITLATSQVARFVHNPKRSHELALIRIGQYLKGTLDKGLILKPTALNQLQVDIYVDAAFACGWNSELGTNPESVKSRTGYLIEIAGCPVLWVSKLQSTIATSTMEAEYTALSMAMRATIPMLAVFKSVIQGLSYQKKYQIQFQATVHEDNQGALTLGKLEPSRHTPRSKFYAIKLHWFRSWLKTGEIDLKFIETAKQKADFLTKPLPPKRLQANRVLSMGW